MLDLLKIASREAPKKLAYFSKSEKITFLELDKKTDEMADLLIKNGVEKSDRVASFFPPNSSFLILLFASLRIGANFCPLHLRIPEKKQKEQLDILSPKIFFNESGFKIYPQPISTNHTTSIFLFTSGTISQKIAILPLSALIANAKSAVEFCQFTEKNYWLLSLPLYHVGGIGIVFRSLLSKSTIIHDPTSPLITHLSYVPTQLYRSWPIYPHLQCILLGGAPIHYTPSNLPIFTSYGMTETCSMIVGNQSLLPHKELKIDESGEIWIRGDSLFKGYWKMALPFDSEGWFPTNDLGEIKQGKIQIIGRKDCQFISGGENIQPEEIEKELLQYPNIIAALVVPKTDPEFGQIPLAFIKTLDGKIDPHSLKNFLQDRLAKFKIPTTFYPFDLIEENSMKISRKKVIEQLKNNPILNSLNFSNSK